MSSLVFCLVTLFSRSRYARHSAAKLRVMAIEVGGLVPSAARVTVLTTNNASSSTTLGLTANLAYSTGVAVAVLGLFPSGRKIK